MANDASTVFDLVILGGGSGGYAAALRGAQLGLDVALIEKDKLGGTCLHRGCIPTKALLHAGELADQAREGAEFGVKTTLEGIDMAGVHKYKDGVVSGLYKGLQGLVASRKVTYVEGEGRLSSPTSVDVNGKRYEGRHILLATGSVPKSLPGLEIDGDRIISSDHALVLDRVPESAVILGGGVIGVEFASAWKSFGTDVTIVEGLPHLVPAEDENSSKLLERAFRKRGINFSLGSFFEKAEYTDNGVKVSLANGKTYEAEVLLVAIGRGPVSQNLGYEEAGVAMDRGFVLADEYCRTNVPTVSAVGDLIPTLQLAHVGFAEGILVAERLAGLNPVPVDYDGVPRVTYCHPEVASVGVIRGEGQGDLRRRQGRHAEVQPGGQRPQQDPQDRGRDQARPGPRRRRGRRPHGGRPHGRAGRRGPADLQLGGPAGRGRATHPRPPDAERSDGRGPPGAGRQAAALPRLTYPGANTPAHSVRSNRKPWRFP